MIKILICCLGGFSSSAMVKKIKSEIIENNLEKEMSVDFSPFMNAKELYIDAVDIINGYDDSKTNPWHFKGEEEIMTVQRACSYRNFKKLSKLK